MLHLLSMTCFFFTVSASNNTMIVVWGLPTSFTGAVVNTTLDLDQCMRACLETRRCVLAHIMLRTTTCRLFMYNVTTTVTKTTAANESVVAFKVISTGVCPVGENPPTFDNKTANGYILVNDGDARYFPLKLYYNISFAKNVWSFSKNIVASCPSVWGGYLQHSDGTSICALFYQVRKSTAANVVYNAISQTFSVSYCKSLSGTLATINYPIDHSYFSWYITYFSATFPTPILYVRIDGKRTPACQANPTTETCMSPKGFTFTDTSFNNFDNYNWVTNSSARAGSDDDCLVYVTNGTAPLKVDVRSCTDKNTVKAFGLFCMKQAYQ